jgi:hypothetical protein
MVGETGVQEDGACAVSGYTPDPNRKANWYLNALATLKSPGWSQFRAFVYFNSDRIYPWMVNTTSQSLNAYKTIGADPYFNP